MAFPSRFPRGRYSILDRRAARANFCCGDFFRWTRAGSDEAFRREVWLDPRIAAPTIGAPAASRSAPQTIPARFGAADIASTAPTIADSLLALRSRQEYAWHPRWCAGANARQPVRSFSWPARRPKRLAHRQRGTHSHDFGAPPSPSPTHPPHGPASSSPSTPASGPTRFSPPPEAPAPRKSRAETQNSPRNRSPAAFHAPARIAPASRPHQAHRNSTLPQYSCPIAVPPSGIVYASLALSQELRKSPAPA